MIHLTIYHKNPIYETFCNDFRSTGVVFHVVFNLIQLCHKCHPLHCIYRASLYLNEDTISVTHWRNGKAGYRF